jgi:hypothetical protein
MDGSRRRTSRQPGAERQDPLAEHPDFQPAIRQNLIAMLDALASRLNSGETSDEDYSRTLNYLRFKVGEALFERFATPLTSRAATQLRARVE